MPPRASRKTAPIEPDASAAAPKPDPEATSFLSEIVIHASDEIDKTLRDALVANGAQFRQRMSKNVTHVYGSVKNRMSAVEVTVDDFEAWIKDRRVGKAETVEPERAEDLNASTSNLKAKGKDTHKGADDASVVVDTSDAPTRRSAPKRKATKAEPVYKDANDEELDEHEEDLPVKKTSRKTVKETSAKLDVPQDTEPEVPPPVQEHVEKRVVEIRKGRAAVDRGCPVGSDYHVFEDTSGIYDAMLNQTNIGHNNNKFYIIQLLQKDIGLGYAVWTRWGRVGANGQTDMKVFPDFPSAFSVFANKFKDKTKNNWVDRHGFQHFAGKYDLLERDYGEDAEPAVSKTVTSPSKPVKEPESKLPERVQNLIRLIFDVKMMAHSMVELGYDATRMPLGKLTKNHIQKGFEVLKELAAMINSATTSSADFTAVSSRFYTIIPHDFGRNKPPLIDTPALLKAKIEMLESLTDIEIATTLMSSISAADINQMDHYYATLKNEIVPLDKDSDRWKLIETYMKNTHGSTHSGYTLELVDVYECKRHGEDEAFQNKNNRMLLWHGSRLTNFVGILSQGLRIAPPEAPVTGYMFGKGVYFADMVSKSANYCATSRHAPNGLLLLCDVSLGQQVELLESDYHADALVKKQNCHSTKGCGATYPNPVETVKIEDDVAVPCGMPIESGVKGSLAYNEFIVYDTSQIRIKYLLNVNFKYR